MPDDHKGIPPERVEAREWVIFICPECRVASWDRRAGPFGHSDGCPREIDGEGEPLTVIPKPPTEPLDGDKP